MTLPSPHEIARQLTGGRQLLAVVKQTDGHTYAFVCDPARWVESLGDMLALAVDPEHGFSLEDAGECAVYLLSAVRNQ